ncbi:sigma-70 family RNA polymerase sigma factor [Mesorhizobium erdmanii]|uniref:sigma-70 family RNA polymerase sigma factor n=1 Tax=Mesorhizobium erdmanii TaxID=1777866 RepID=UPI0004267BD8|nr:sigma-70 family RNA polymerase sigma factor [Mesorhizobium erdmanii]
MNRDDISRLILRTSMQDRAAFDLLYRHTSGKLFGICLGILGHRCEAEEALQEVYVKIWSKADRFVISELSPISWLAAIARNHAIDRVRSRRPATADLAAADDVADPTPLAEALLIAADDTKRVHRCIDALGREKAEAVRGAYIEGLSYAQLAERHDVPINTMRTWLRRGLINIRANFGE